jgi:hydroxypyruvate reductase
MAHAAVSFLGSRVRRGLVIGQAAASIEGAGGLEVLAGGHPVPTGGSELAGRRALALAGSLGDNEMLLVLLSGGASALMAVPAPGVVLADKSETTSRLLRAGADIHALNTVRKHLSAIKGGWLAARAPGACHACVISDVVGDDLSVIASGPTVADGSRFEDAIEVLRRFGGGGAYPDAVVARLDRGARGAFEETPKTGDPRLERATTAVIGSRRNAMEGAVAEAAARGYHVVRLEDPVIGEARIAAVTELGAVAAQAAGVARPACFVSSGETTVHVTGRGKGGRNQEFVLAAVDQLAEIGPASAISLGTDGIDGPTDAAGAYADSTTRDRALAASLRPRSFLADNNAYPFFHLLGDLVRTGPTGTNVGDLQVILLG